MIAVLAAFAVALGVAASTELAPLGAEPHPLAWIFVVLLYPFVDGMLSQVTKGAAKVAVPPLVLGLAHAAIVFPLGYGAWVLEDLGWLGKSLPSLGLLLLPAATLSFWASPWKHLRDRRAGQGGGGTSEPYARWLCNRARIILVPGLLLVSLTQGADWLESNRAFHFLLGYHPGAGALLCAILLVTLFAISPIFVLAIWPTKQLPDGQLRASMESVAKEQGAQLRSIRVWDERTRNIVYACVVGLLPRTRTVFFTQGLLALLTPGETLAVFCHELAHLVLGHFSDLALFAVTFFVSLAPVKAFGSWLPSWAEWLLLSLYTAAYWGLLYGALSRRLETEADLKGAQVAGFDLCASALHTVGALSGALRGKSGLRHLSVERRLQILRDAASDPHLGSKLEEGRRRRRKGMLGCLAVALIGLLATPWIERGDSDSPPVKALAQVELAERCVPVAARAAARAQSPDVLAWLARNPRDVLADWDDILEAARNSVEDASNAAPASASDWRRRLEALSTRMETLRRPPETRARAHGRQSP